MTRSAEDVGEESFPVAEIFGPTLQGEGPEAGRPAYFVRFGGCDFRCSWCDSMHAVDAAAVRGLPRLGAQAIVAALEGLTVGPRLVVLSGGNPLLHELGPVVDALHIRGYDVAVETQGSVWRDWVMRADRVVVSPKPPSSRMTSVASRQAARAFCQRLPHGVCALKFVVFDLEDLDWVERFVADDMAEIPLFLSVGTDVGLSDEATDARLRDRMRWLWAEVAARPELAAARMLPQLHVLAYGTRLGV